MIVYCDNKGCAFQEQDRCDRPHITLRDHALLPPAAFLRACISYEKRKMKTDLYTLSNLFEEQYGDLPVGGFLNPEIVAENDRRIVFRCHYDNYENEDDVWHYGFDIATQQFHAA